MFKNYLTIAVRNLFKHKGYSVINIMGLAIGMACCVLIILFVQDELSYDQYHEKKDRIYRLAESGYIAGKFLEAAVTPAPWAPALVNDYPEIEHAVRLRPPGSRWLVRYEEKRFYEKGFFYADSTVFDVFTLPLVKGHPKTALTAPNTVVFSETMVKKYFGDEDPIGKMITADNVYKFTITGIMRDLPQNSHFHFDFLASYATLPADSLYGEPATFQTAGFSHNFYTYLLLKEGYPSVELEKKFPDFLDKYLGEQLRTWGIEARPYLQPVTDIHLRSHLDAEIEANSDIRYIYIFSSLACFLLLIACINFMNLATARSAHRAQEVGMRKVLGAYRTQIMGQFVGESILLALIALVAAIGLAHLLLPQFNYLSGKQLEMDYLSNWLAPALIGIALLVGIMAGGYPAFFLSSFRPVAVLTGALKAGAANAILRKVLVVFQFAISIIMIIGTAIVFNQVNYMQNMKLGFDKEQVLVARLPDQAAVDGYESYKNALLQYPEIVSVSSSSSVPGPSPSINLIVPEGVPEDQSPAYQMIWSDYDFIDVMGIELAEGRNFSQDFSTDSTACLINEAVVRALGWEDPIGKRFTFPFPGAPELKVIGVMRDFHLRSLHQQIEPLMILFGGPGSSSYMEIKIRGENVPRSLEILLDQWETTYPTHPTMEYSFLDEDLDKLYAAEQRLGSIFVVGAILSIFIACLGLFGLASFMAEQRTKEIGVRKVLGASVKDIVLLLSKDFTRLVVIAFVIGAPVVYYFMNLWLQEFPYRVDLSVWTFVFAGIVALMISWLTVGYQALKAAMTNPADALQYE